MSTCIDNAKLIVRLQYVAKKVETSVQLHGVVARFFFICDRVAVHTTRPSNFSRNARIM